jgi:hypothetical protein
VEEQRADRLGTHREDNNANECQRDADGTDKNIFPRGFSADFFCSKLMSTALVKVVASMKTQSSARWLEENDADHRRYKEQHRGCVKRVTARACLLLAMIVHTVNRALRKNTQP